MVCWSTKASISLKRVKTKDRGKVTMDREPIELATALFRTVPSPTPYHVLLFPKIGGSQPTQNSNAIISGRGEAMLTSNLAGTFTGYIRTKVRNFGDKGAWAYPGTVQIFWVPPIITGTGKTTNFKFGRNIQGSIRTKAHYKFWRKESVGVSRDCPSFWVPPIISGTGKATNFKFCTHYS